MRSLLLIAGIVISCLGACGDSENEPISRDSSAGPEAPEKNSADNPSSKNPGRGPKLSLKEAETRLGIELPKDATIIRAIELGAEAPKGLSVALHLQRPMGELESYFRTRLDPEVGKRFLPMQRERWATRNMIGKQYRLAEYEERESPWKIKISLLSGTGQETVQVNVQRFRRVAPVPTSRPR